MDAKSYSDRLTPLLTQAAAYAHSLIRHRSDAEDAVQQAALRGWERIDQYDATRPFKGWWFAILRNCCFDVHRSNQARKADSLESAERAEQPPTSTPDPHSLDVALTQIAEAHREILRMKYFGGLKYDEIAEALGIPRGTVMSRLPLARKALAALMQEEMS
jgi:RNA polymerase sigma-70 factor, ECF subfamily